MIEEERHREVRTLMGAYLIGGLDSADRQAFEEHLATCVECREELARLAPIPGLLARTRGDDDHPPRLAVPTPSDDLLARTLAAAATSTRRRRRVRIAVAAASLLAVAAAGATLARVTEDAGPAPSAVVDLRPTPAAGDASGSASLVARPWGTALSVELAGMPAEGPFRLTVRDAAGTEHVAASWGPTPAGTMVLQGAANVATAEVRSVVVAGPDGALLRAEVAGD